jgi:hypothetical protein
MEANSNDFATTPAEDPKSLKLEPPELPKLAELGGLPELPVTAALLYARTG